MSTKEKGVFVTDHDGTMTDADKEALYYDEIVLDYLSEKLEMGGQDLEKMLEEAKTEIKSMPEKYGWVKNGFIVAPASADHYIFNTVATEMVLEKLREGLGYTKLPKKEDQDGFMQEFFKETSATLGTLGSFYREGVREYVEELSSAGDFVIVTNSSPETVAKKLATLFGEESTSLNLLGNAKKYDVAPEWVGVVPSEKVMLEGFPRGVYLQRKTYYETLAKLVSGDVERIAICGDIAELDTLMIDYLGCRTALVEGGTSSPWEIAYYKNGNEKRFVSKSLGEIASWLVKR